MRLIDQPVEAEAVGDLLVAGVPQHHVASADQHRNVAGAERMVEGMYQCAEAQLNALPDEAFLELRKAGAVQLGYTQLLSMHRLQHLGTLATQQAEAAQRSAAALVRTWSGLVAPEITEVTAS